MPNFLVLMFNFAELIKNLKINKTKNSNTTIKV